MGSYTSTQVADDAPQNPRMIRRFTGNEEYVTHPRRQGHPAHIIASVAHVTGPVASITRNALEKALLQAAHKYLYLRAIVHLGENRGQGYFEEADAEALPSLISTSVVFGPDVSLDADDWKSLLTKELDTYCPGTDSSNPSLPWKLIFLRSRNKNDERCTLIHMVDHLIEDGRANQIFFSEFLSNLSKVVQNRPLPPLVPFPFDERVSSQYRREGSISLFQAVVEFGKLMYRNSYVTDSPPNTPIIPLYNRHYEFEFMTLTEEETSKIISASKTQGVTVTSTLAGLALTAIKNAIQPGLMQSHYVVVVGIDLRPFYKPLPGFDNLPLGEKSPFKELFGSHIDVRMNAYGVDGAKSFWDVAKAFDADSKHHVESGRITRDGLHLEAHIPPITQLAANNKNGRYAMMHYSNRGVWQVSEDFGNFNISEFYFTAPMKLIGATILFNVQTVKGKLNFTFTFIDEIVPKPLREAFVTSFRELLATVGV